MITFQGPIQANIIGYRHHLVNVITFRLSQSDHFNQLSLSNKTGQLKKRNRTGKCIPLILKNILPSKGLPKFFNIKLQSDES